MTNTMTTDQSVAVGRRRGRQLHARRQDVGVLRDAPRRHDRGHRAHREQARTGVARRSQQHERPEAAQRREDHERERARREPVEHVDGVVVEHEDPGERDDAGHDRGDHGAPPEVLDHVGVSEPAGVPHHVDGREVRAHGDREHAAEDRGRVDPARPRVAGLAARGDPARRDRARDRAHAERARSPTTTRTRRRSCAGSTCA